jgi:hypothetical protein
MLAPLEIRRPSQTVPRLRKGRLCAPQIGQNVAARDFYCG